ncbi:hypothetical protein D3C80_1976290 [compost metagenome]
MVISVGILTAIKIVHGHTLKHTNRDLSGFIRSTVIHFEAGTTTSNVDTALAQYHLVLAINALVTIPDNEQIVRTRRY